MPDVDLVFAKGHAGSRDLIFGGGVAAPPASDPGMQVTGSVVSRWQAMELVSSGIEASHDDGAHRSTAIASAWRDLDHRSNSVSSAWQDSARLRVAVRSTWEELLRTRNAVRSGWVDLIRTRNSTSTRWQRGQLLQRVALDHWQRGIGTGAGWADRWQVGEVVQLGTVMAWQRGIGTDVAVRSWWQRAMRPLPGYWLPPVDPGSIPLTEHDLIFCGWQSGATDIIFGDDRCAVGRRVPIKDIYIVINTFTLVRISDGYPLYPRDFSAAIDRDGPHWSWSAALLGSDLDAIVPDVSGNPVELLATVNGTPLRLVVEAWQRDRRFAESWLTVRGRSRSMWLSDPYAPVESRDNALAARTAHQLIEDALTVNGVLVGWTVDWQPADWLVPAGAWSHRGTAMDAALRIAESAGAYIQAHRTDQQLIILPHYPIAPWGWAGAVADLDLPENVVAVEGIESVSRPDYNGVYVTGSAVGGRNDLIRRTGTAGDVLAEQITDALSTDPTMTMQRALPVLGNTGRQSAVTLRLPVLPETGLITPGQLVRYSESGTVRIGLSRSLSIQHVFPELWQTITLETHDD